MGPILRLATGLAACAALAAAAADCMPEARKLAADRGCATCHPDRPVAGEAVLATAPSWKSIAARYAGRADAEERLAQVVITGSDPAVRHWSGHAQFDRMLPNEVEVDPEEARTLVRWILGCRK